MQEEAGPGSEWVLLKCGTAFQKPTFPTAGVAFLRPNPLWEVL